ncbi:MAG: DUF4197 domain-containing protein [Pseudomonadota bacterium]
MRSVLLVPLLAASLFLAGCPMLEGVVQSSGVTSNAPTAQESQSATRQALLQGVDRAVASLGKEGGFSTTAYRLPLPEELRSTAERARNMGLGRYVDEFELSLSRAAEEAVPAALPVFKSAVADMSIADAVALIQGEEDAATRYFKRQREDQLQARFKPIADRALAEVGVVEHYEKLAEKVAYYGRLVGYEPPAPDDLSGYVARQASDALFDKMAEEEALIRQDPVGRGTDLVKKVFGHYLETPEDAAGS